MEGTGQGSGRAGGGPGGDIFPKTARDLEILDLSSSHISTFPRHLPVCLCSPALILCSFMFLLYCTYYHGLPQMPRVTRSGMDDGQAGRQVAPVADGSLGFGVWDGAEGSASRPSGWGRFGEVPCGSAPGSGVILDTASKELVGRRCARACAGLGRAPGTKWLLHRRHVVSLLESSMRDRRGSKSRKCRLKTVLLAERSVWGSHVGSGGSGWSGVAEGLGGLGESGAVARAGEVA